MASAGYGIETEPVRKEHSSPIILNSDRVNAVEHTLKCRIMHVISQLHGMAWPNTCSPQLLILSNAKAGFA